jgi:N12 class adenine-specific DNA methylase
MPIDNNKLKKVWDTLRNGGYTQDYKTFVKGFSGDSNYENRKKVYDLLTENGAQIGKDYGEFMSKLHTDTPIRRAPQPKPTPTVKNPLHLPEGFGTVDLKDPMAKVRDANEVSDAVRGIESGNAEKAAAGRKKLAGVSARLEKEREAAKPAMDLLSAPLTEEQKSYVRHRKDAADYQAETGRKMPSVFGAGFERFGMLDADDYTKGVAPARIFVPEAERDEKGRITGRYSITSDKGAQRADRDARQGAIDRLKTIDAEEAEKERLSTTEGKDAEIADTESRIKELDAKMAARRRKLGIPQGGGTLSIAMNVAANADEEYNALSAARRQEELRLRSLKDRRFGGNDDYWWQIYRGAQGAVEKFLGYDTASDLAKYRAAGSASGFDKGVDEARQMFMEALDKNEREQAVAAGSGGLAREFGQLTGNSAIYMLPFMFGGKVIGGIQTLSRAAMRGAVKTAAGQAARKGVASALGRYTKRALGAVAEDMAIGLTGASTVGMPATLGQAAENYAGKLEQDENGRYYYTGGDDTAHAFVTALLSNSFEYSSEMAGEHMESLWKAGKKSFAKTRLGMSIDRLFAPSKDGNRLVRYYNGIKSGAEAWLERLRKTKAGSAAYNAADFITEGGARMFRHAHIQDLPFEGLEEELNNIENAAFQTGQGSWEDVADNEQRWKLWAGLAISMATTGAVFGGISTVQYGGRMAGQYRAKHLMDRADVLARYRMTEEVWKPIKDGLDNADNADMGTVIAKALGTVKTDEERKEILNYARRLLEYRGYNIATTVGAAQGDGGADAGDMAYSEGYETTDANDMHNIKTRYEEARRKVEADGVNPDGTDVRTHIEMMLGARNEDGTPYYTDEEVQPYIDYLNAKAAFDGSLERVRDDIDSGVAESEAAVDRRTGKDGMVHPAVMKQPKADGTERSVYILAGNVEFTGDGGVVIDPKDTRGSIVVCGEDGTMEMVSPDAIREVGDAIDPETEKEEAAEAVRQRIAQDAADKFDNTPKYGVNDTFVMTGEDGTPVSGVVQRVSEDGVEAAVGGRVALIPTEQFEAAVQEVRDAYGNVSWRRTPEDAAEADVQENGENVPNTTENVPNTTESVQGTPGNAPQDLVEEQKPDAAVQENGNSDAVGRSLSESETETVISEMKSGAQAAPEMELNPKNWLSQFGEDGVVTTPIGNVKMGENQYFKLAQRGRDGKLGMVKPTLETPDVIVEDSSKAKENGAEERPSSYVFVKTFTKADGSRYYHFTSVTVSKDGGEVVVSNQEKSENRISRLLRNGRIVWIDAAFSLHPTAQDRVSVPLGDSNRLTPTDSQSALLGVSSPEHSAGKDTEQNSDMQAEGGENASALSLIPKDANGEPVYTAADAYTAWDALVEQCGGDAGMAQGVADSMVKDMETALKKAEKSAPAHGVTVAEKIAAAKGHKAAVEKARTELEKWRAIAGETASRARAAEEAERRRKKERLDAAREELRRNGRYVKEDAALGDYTDFADYAMRTIATGKYRFLWGDRESGTQGLGAHLGFTGSRTERNKRIWLLSKDGFTPEEAAERMLADYSAAAGFDSVGDTGVDSMEALDVILDVLRRYTSPRAMMDDAKAAHAENGESAEERRQGEEYERGQFMEAYHMTPEEYYEYENEWLPRYMEEAAQVPQEVIDNINAEYAEKYSENGKDDYNGGEDARGVPPVQGERLDKPGGDEGGGDTGGAAGAVGEGDAAGGFVPQGASGREVRAGEVPQPVGKGAFGDIYDQFRGDAKAAFDFLTKHRSGDLLGVFHRDDTGDIDLVWGDENSGLSHILTKHVGKGKDFGTEQAAFDKIESILKNGKLIQDGRLRYVVSEDGYRVAIRKDYDGVKKNWIVTAVDYNRSKEEKEITTNPTSASHGANGPELAAPNNSKGKVTEESADLQENGGKDAGGKAEMPLSEQIDAASAEVNTEPTEAQKEAGNYKKGHVQVGMFDITIEQPEGSIRRGTDADGKQWESKMHNTYGYFRGTEGVDGDHIDVFLSNDIDGWNGRKVYVVDQYNPDGSFDEHKVMLGFNDMDEAKSDYLANYEKGWEDGRRIVVSATNLEDFEKWIDSSHRKTKPFAEYAGVKKETVANVPAKEEAAAQTDNNDNITDEEIENAAFTLGVHGESQTLMRLELDNTPERAKQILDAAKKWNEKNATAAPTDNAAYTITPATYTNKKGKTSDVSLLMFNGELTANQERAVKEFAKERLGEGRFAPARGWKDRESGGWMFRSEEDARKAAEMVGNDDAVADNQPLTAQEMRDAVEPKKPTASKKTAAKKPANRVEVADVAEQKPSEPTKAEQPKQDGEKKLVITDEMKHDEDILRELLGIGDEELDGGIKFRDPDAMTSQQRRFVYNAGVNYSLGYIDQGFVKFPEFAKAMVSRLGYKIKPWLKSFYEGAKRIPGYDQTMFTPTEEVDAFDVENFDKPNKDVMAQANMIVEEGKAQVAAEKANNELKATRNEQRKETEKQTAADTDAVAAEAETVASETESLAETSSDEQALNGAAERVDETLDKVNDQLVLLGYYEVDQVEKDFNEAYGYMRNAEKKAVKDAANLASQLIDDLGLDRYEATHGEADKKGKRKTKPLAVANIAPAGGDVTMHLPLAEGRELYVNIQLEPAFDKGDTDRRGDNLEVTGIMCRVENPNASGNDRYGQNMWFAEDVTYDELLKNVQRATYKYIPERGNVKEGEYKVGDKVQYSPDGNTWHDAVVAQPNELDGIRIDTGQAPVMWVNAHPDQLRHKAQTEPQNEDIFQKAERIAKEAREKKAAKAASEPTTTPASTEQPKPAMKKKASKKKVKPEQQVGNLFAGLFDEPKEENGLQRNDDAVRTEAVPTDNRGQQQGLRGGESTTRKAAAQESGRPDGGRGGQSTGANRAESAGLHGLTEPKNTRNNHSERGADHAPTSVNGRIEANIKAIELAHELLESGETATPEQMRVLRQFSGWGGLGAAFSDGGYDWKLRERNKKIRELLGEEAYEQAVMSANSAYYTPAYVVDTLWDIAGQLGFKGGNILEGSAGIGNILGQMPTTVSERSNIHAIEIDGTSGGILSLLYPDAKVEIQGFEQTRIPNGSVDLAITNVPFVTGLRVNDTTGDSDLSKKFHNIHDFCIAKNVRKLREGGLGIFISSNGTLDNSKALRDWVVNEGGSDFIGAFRMNNKTFGGTTVTSDIIVVRKRVNGQKSAQAIDVSNISGERTAEYEEPGARKAKQLSMDYNKYFIEHPDHMAGEMRFAFEEGDTFRPTSKGLYPVSGKDQGKMLADFVKSFTEETGSSVATMENAKPSYVSDVSADGKKLGEMYLKDGKLVTAGFGGYYPLEVNDKKIKGHTKQECFTAYAAIKTALADVMKYQTENEGDAGLQPLIDKLNKAYDAFVSTYGHFTKNNQLAWLRNDVDYPNVFSLEVYKEQGDGKGGVVKTYDKADVMKGRVVEKESEPHPENVKDGVVVSMFKNGRIDVPYIAGQLGMSEDAVKHEIIESGLGFEDPATRQMEVSYKYLSGNVREKLKQAEANNENGEYTGNIKALQEVVPMNIPAHLIDFTLGSSWLDPKLYDEYVKDRTDIDVHFTAAGGTWFMKAPTYGTNVEKNRAMGIVSEMLKKTIMGHELIGAAIQNKSVIVSRTEKHYDGTTETITDREATSACAAKIDEIRQDFKDWMRQKMQSDADLSARMETEYNDRFNNYVPMSIPDDFVPEYFGGATHKFKMRPHQGKAIVRGTMQPLLLAHEVGTGKTFTLISTAMEMRRLGTARKPMIVVQNATVGQFAASAKELYPNAKILTLEDNDRNAEGRKNFYAKIKYNDWDMIVVPQSTFEFIPDSDERQMQFVQDKIDEKMLVLEQMRQADTSGRDPITRRAEKELADLQAEMAALSDGISKKRSANNEKKKAVAKQNAAVKAQEMLDRRTDDVEDFDDMGIDALLIDEAHEYKHLGFTTAMQRGVKGVDPSYSKKSQGVYLKTQAVLEKNNGRNVIFATGTPISNTAAEIWTFMRYLMPKDTMKEYGIYYFDDFVRNFGNIQQMPEFNTSGKFKEVNRFAGYVNLPELVRIWSGVADTVLTKDQTELVKKIPEIEGGKAQDIYLPQTRALRSVMKYVRAELDRFDQMSGKEKKENSSIPLTMYGIAQGAAVDARLVEMDAEDDPRSKTNEAVRQTLRSLKETDDYKGTVAIFADHYQNKRSGFNLYEDIKQKLIAQGVPESEVVVMKPGMTIKKKLEIFDKVNRGEVRVVLGSTATLGTGVNIQERLHTLIHLDAPNRPMDYTQRNGRILRQGNLHKQWGKPVRVLRFGVEDSLDVTAYQRLKTKGAIANSVMEGDRLMQDSMNNRVLEEEEDVFGDTVAQLSGSEYALLKNNAEKNVRKYESRRKQWEADQTYIHNAKPKLEGQIKAAEKRAEEANAHLLAVQKAFPDGKFTEITVGKQKFGSVDAMVDFIKEHNKKILDAVKAIKEHPSNAAQTNTLTLSLGGYDFVVKTDMSRETQNIGGSLFAEIHRKMTYSCPELGLTDIPVKQSLLRNAVEDITENVITGKDFAERFDIATRMVKHGKSELEQLKQREGKPFEFGKELEEAKRQFEEYSEAMKVEMAEKEKKYAEMDASVEAATDVAVDVEDDTPGGDAKFRSMEMDVTDVADEERDAMTARVNELAERLHTPVRIIRTDEEVAALPSTRQRRMKGSFNPMTGEVTIVVPNNANMADVENTFLHEVVGHDGLRVLFPEEEKLNNALDELYRVSKDGIQDTIDRMARKMYDAEVDRLMRSKRREHEASGGNADAHYFTDLAEAHVEADRKRGKFKRDATEEYGADLAGRIGEKGFEKMSAEELTFWGRLKAVLQNALRKLAEGLGIPGVRKWGDNEWAFVLHEAYKRKRNGGKPSVADAADTVAARESSGFDGELYRVGDVKTFRDGRGIEFRRKPTATFNALLAHLEKEGVKTERHKARTGSEYASFSRYGVMYEVRNADHTKAKSADRRAEESGVEVTDWDGMIRHIDMDLVQARMNAADVYALMDEAERFNSEDEAVRRAATEDGVGSAEFRDAYPTLWRVMGLKSPEEARMEHLRKKYADEYYTARGKELDKLYPFTASNGVTIGRGRKFRVPKSIVYGKGDARRAAEEEFDKAYKKVYDEFIPLDDFVRQREQEGNLEEVNRRFNEQLQLYRNGEMDKNEMLRLGRPQGVMRAFLPNLPIVMRQRILTKGSVRKHNVSVEALANMPTHLAHPIFVFKRSDNALGVLTEMQDRDGKNICVAIELNRQIQNGGEILEVNDIRSVHGRNVSDIVYPIVQNGTLEWADKEKGLAYLSSASRYVQQEIDKQDLDTAAKVVENFENPKVSDEKASDEDLMFRDGDNAEYNKALARDIYERRVSRGLFQTQEALQDSMLGLKEAMDAILKAEGKGRVYIEDVAGFENAYLGENRLSSVNQAECSEFGQRLFKPLLKEAARLAKTAEERAELTDYMMAKHGLERNEVMARRDARKKAREELAKELAKAEKSADKNAVADVKQRMQDRENELYKENRKRDYAGLTALTGMPYVGDAEDEARRMVADYEREHAVKTLWDRVNAVNAATLLKSYESGMISRETYDDIRGMYKNYIPLRGFDEKTAEDAYAYVSSEGRGGFNAPIRTAKGRKSKADDPFANMEAMAESAIMQGNRNVLVKQRFMNFAVNHPSDLVSISDLWLWKNDATGEWQPLNAGGIRGTEAIGEDDTPAEVARKMRDFEAAVEQAAKDDPEHFRRQKENPAVPYRVVESRDLRQHQVIVRRNGRDYVLTINGNPRAAQALNGLTNPDNDISGAIGKIMRFGEKVNRELSAFYTTRNPDFVVSNFLRDMMYANTMVWVKETPNYAVRFHMNVLKLNPAKMKLLLAKFRKGTLNDKDETERMFRQFMMNGGETGYSSVKDIDRRKNDIRRELKKYNGKIPLQGAYTLLGERLDEYNRAVENCARFAAFMTSRQMMRSIDRSVYDAKEISVNFNKKGSGAKFIDAKGQTRLGRIAAGLSGAGRSLYVFFNAAIQGTANYARQFRRHPVKALTGAAVMYLLGTLMAHIGGSGDDDDEKGNSYWDLPEWTRRSNIMFRAGGQWVCIPLPVEYRVFYGMGELAVSAIEGREQLTPGELASAVAAQLSQALPIDLLEGGGGLSNLMPSIVKPGVEAYTNTSWTGLPIYRKNDFNKNDPEWTKAYRNTNKYLVAVAEKLNEATGGDKYTKGAVNINPAQVEYLLNGYFGGVSGTVDKLVKSAETLAGQREYDPRSFLLLNRIVKKGDERTTQRAVNNEYARLEDKFDALGKRLRGYRHDTTYGIFDFAEKANFIYNSPEYMEMMEFNACKKAVDKCRTLIKNSASPEDAKGYEEKINGMKRDIVERLGKTKRPAARAGAYIGAGAFYKAFTEAKMKEAE